MKYLNDFKRLRSWVFLPERALLLVKFCIGFVSMSFKTQKEYLFEFGRSQSIVFIQLDILLPISYLIFCTFIKRRLVKLDVFYFTAFNLIVCVASLIILPLISEIVFTNTNSFSLLACGFFLFLTCLDIIYILLSGPCFWLIFQKFEINTKYLYILMHFVCGRLMGTFFTYVFHANRPVYVFGCCTVMCFCIFLLSFLRQFEKHESKNNQLISSYSGDLRFVKENYKFFLFYGSVAYFAYVLYSEYIIDIVKVKEIKRFGLLKFTEYLIVGINSIVVSMFSSDRRFVQFSFNSFVKFIYYIMVFVFVLNVLSVNFKSVLGQYMIYMHFISKILVHTLRGEILEVMKFNYIKRLAKSQSNNFIFLADITRNLFAILCGFCVLSINNDIWRLLCALLPILAINLFLF